VRTDAQLWLDVLGAGGALDVDAPLPARLHTPRCALRALGLVFQPRGFGITG
jgi:hypothetical protein